MPFAPALTPARLRGRVLRVAVAASLVLGVAAALPSSAEEGVYTDDRGRLEAPGPFTPGGLVYSAFCPDAPPEQGISVWLYELPEHAAVAGATLTVTGQGPAGPAFITGSVYNGECGYDRGVSPAAGERGLRFAIEPGDRYLIVSTIIDAQVDLLLTVKGEGVTQTAPAAGPSPAPDGVYVDDRGRLEAPGPLTPGRLLYSSLCPGTPPEQGISVWRYDLPEHAAVVGATLTVTGRGPAGPAFISGTVYNGDCSYDRGVSPAAGERGLSFAIEPDDRYLLVSTILDAQVALLLTVKGEGVTQTAPPAGPSPSPTQEPEAPSDGVAMARGSYPTINDPLYVESSTAAASTGSRGQWGMRTIRAHQAWQEQRATGAGVRVAVLDTGLDVTHPDFACAGKVARLDPTAYPRFAEVKDTDGHGTHVAGIVGACTGNGTGVVGTAPDATILPIQALSPTEATAERLGAAIRAAVDNGAHVINMSLGFGAHSSIGTAASEAGIFARTVEPAIEHAVAKGVVVVAAAGNSAFPICGYPALAEDVVCVGSTDRRDLNAAYGNFPVTPYGTSLVAPGGSLADPFCDGASEGVLSTYSRAAAFQCPSYPGYRSLDGTSMASPHVAGVAALVYDRLGATRSPAAAQQVVAALKAGAKDLYTPGYDPLSGEGRVDALGAVRAVTPVTDGSTTAPTPTETATAAPSPTADAERATTLELVAPATGQTTDALPLAARVTDDAGDAVAGAPVAFRLSGAGGAREVTATTGADGVAATSLPLDLAPGSYRLDGAYAGEPGSRTGSADDQPVEVVRDDSTTTLAVDGNGSKRTLTVHLADEDTASTGLAGRTVVLLADGEQVGSVVTDDNGSAAYVPAGKARGAKTYEARFAGDDSYTGSSATASS